MDRAGPEVAAIDEVSVLASFESPSPFRGPSARLGCGSRDVPFGFRSSLRSGVPSRPPVISRARPSERGRSFGRRAGAAALDRRRGSCAPRMRPAAFQVTRVHHHRGPPSQAHAHRARQRARLESPRPTPPTRPDQPASSVAAPLEFRLLVSASPCPSPTQAAPAPARAPQILSAASHQAAPTRVPTSGRTTTRPRAHLRPRSTRPVRLGRTRTRARLRRTRTRCRTSLQPRTRPRLRSTHTRERPHRPPIQRTDPRCETRATRAARRTSSATASAASDRAARSSCATLPCAPRSVGPF